MQTLLPCFGSVNRKFAPTSLQPFLLKRKGESDQLWYAPICGRCHKPILDLADCNVSTVNSDFETAFFAEFDGAKLYALDGEAFAFHKSCDRSENKPWTVLPATKATTSVPPWDVLRVPV